MNTNNEKFPKGTAKKTQMTTMPSSEHKCYSLSRTGQGEKYPRHFLLNNLSHCINEKARKYCIALYIENINMHFNEHNSLH